MGWCPGVPSPPVTILVVASDEGGEKQQHIRILQERKGDQGALPIARRGVREADAVASAPPPSSSLSSD